MLEVDMLVEQKDIKSTIKKLKDNDKYNLLLDITAIDYLTYNEKKPIDSL